MAFTGVQIDRQTEKPEAKLSKAMQKIDDILSNPARVNIHKLASAVGLLTHLTLTTRAGATSLRSLWSLLAKHQVSADGRHAPQRPTSKTTADLRWWRVHLTTNTQRRLWPRPDDTLDVWAPDVVEHWSKPPPGVLVLTTDASGTGWGIVVSGHGVPGGALVRVRWGGNFSDAQAGCSSNWRETKGGELAVRLFGEWARGGRSLMRQDNTCSVRSSTKGTALRNRS